MKKLVFVFAAAACMLLSAATAKAQLYFGGSVGFASTTVKSQNGNNDNSRTGSSYKLVPEVGFKISDRIAVGGRIGYGNGANTFADIDPNGNLATAMNEMGNDVGNRNTRTTNFTFAPYARFTIVDGRRFSIFVDGVLTYGMQKSESKDGQGVWQDAGKMSCLELGAKPGFMIDLGSHFAVIGHLGFAGFQSISDPDTDWSATRIGTALSTNNLTVGFIYSL